MARALVIVESVAKATRIQSMLGPDFIVKPSVGHIRDLPESAAEIPAAIKAEKWARLGINVDEHFQPVYVVSSDRKKIVSELKAALKEVDELYLASDEDREGEAIAWHLLEVLKPKIPVKRMVFHEITPAAIQRAVDDTRDINQHLVDAQEGRRFLDRLVGYEVSTVLWRAVDKARSAGRVQSVAVRLVVERERERMAFVPAGWYDVTAIATTSDATVEITMDALDGRPLATGKNFDAAGQIDPTADVAALDGVTAAAIGAALPGHQVHVDSITSTPRTQRPQPPFMTSSLQIEASRKLRFDPERTMRAAQRLYEQGWITYMRTDSTTLSDEALRAARKLAAEMYGSEYVADQPRRYERKVKNAQEAHEAIRPAGEEFRTLDEAHRSLGGDELVVYDLIWKRTIASQMVDARLTQDKVRLSTALSGVAGVADGTVASFSATGMRIEFPGFRRAYVEGTDDPEAELADQERILPAMTEGTDLPVTSADAKAHETKAPDRYSEATLIKKLEDLGIGRPSTYASVMKTIDRRGYVWKKGKSLVPAFRAFAVVNLLSMYFADLVDYSFTAQMEDQLDQIASGEQELEPWLRSFYFGDKSATTEFAKKGLHVATTEPIEFDYSAINSLTLGTAPDGEIVAVRSGRYGPYLIHGERRVSIPEATEPDSLTVAHALELLDAPSGDRQLGANADGLPVYLKAGRYGPYIQLGEMSDGEKPQTASLLSSQSPETITLDDALALLALPREVGRHPDDNEPITATNGRYGPYISWGKESRSLASDEEIFTVDLAGALALLAQPRQGRRRVAANVREVGVDSSTGLTITARTGKFGPYVTDGTTNATLRLGDAPETISLDRASELLAERRNADPSTARPRKAAAKKVAKNAVAKKSAGARKSPAKKAAPASKTAAKKAAVAKKAKENSSLEKAVEGDE